MLEALMFWGAYAIQAIVCWGIYRWFGGYFRIAVQHTGKRLGWISILVVVFFPIVSLGNPTVIMPLWLIVALLGFGPHVLDEITDNSIPIVILVVLYEIGFRLNLRKRRLEEERRNK